jgi:hypothetical protein
VRQEYVSSTVKLAKVREARGSSVKSSQRSCEEGADRGRVIPISRSRVLRDWRGRVEIHDS